MSTFQSATIFERLGRRFVIAEEGTRSGTRDALPLIEVTGLPASVQGRAVIFALDCYREEAQGQEVGPRRKPNPLHLLAGVRSWSKFDESAKCVILRQVSGELNMVPTLYRGPRYGHEPKMEKGFNVSLDAEVIGKSLDEAFLRCS